MLFISSPAKRLDFSIEWDSKVVSEAFFINEANSIANFLKNQSIDKLSKTLKISTALAELNYKRYQDWDSTDIKKAKPALLAYQGDVYKFLDVYSLNNTEGKYLQKHFRIISGMYGLLKPYDLIQAYRLEMKIKLGNQNINSLYDFWTGKITAELNRQIVDGNYKYCVNLASQEYSKVIDLTLLKVPLININFSQLKNGVRKSIGIHNKKARGQMIRYFAQNKVTTISDIEKFNIDGYELVEKNDTEMFFLKH